MPEPAFFETTYTPDYAEMFAVARASRRYHYTSGQRGFWWGVFAVYILVIALFSFFGDRIAAYFTPFVGELAAVWMPVAIIVVFALLFFWLVSLRLGPRLSAKWLTERKPPQPTRFIADTHAVRWEAPEFGSWVAWTAIERLFVTPEAICLLYGGQTLFIPRRVFQTNDALRAFIDRALALLSDKARQQSETDPAIAKERGR